MLYRTLSIPTYSNEKFSMAIVAVLAMCRLPSPGGGCRHVLLLRPIGKERRPMNGRRRGEKRAETAEKCGMNGMVGMLNSKRTKG